VSVRSTWIVQSFSSANRDGRKDRGEQRSDDASRQQELGDHAPIGLTFSTM
jgi:hypothetical protein